jgi:hypothetical protein
MSRRLKLKHSEDAEIKLAELRDYWLKPSEPDSFYIDGFPTRIDQLADGFSTEAAATLRRALT